MQYSSISSSSTGERCVKATCIFDLYSVFIIECCSGEGCVVMMDEIVPTSGNVLDAQNDAM